MLKKIAIIIMLLYALLCLAGCDRRNAATGPVNDTSFSTSLTMVRDLSTGYNLVDISFKRDNVPFSDAIIRVGNDTIPNAGGEYYYINSSQFNLSSGSNQIFFGSPEDNYSQSVYINIPGNFEIESVVPQINPAALDVTVTWSLSNGATKYLLVVATENHGFDGTSPFFTQINSPVATHLVPESTFEDAIGDIVDAVYYVYVAKRC